MKAIARLLLALVLTLPMYTSITSIPLLYHWFASGAGWEAMQPIFHAFSSVGGEQNEDILFGALLIASFVAALGASFLLIGPIGRLGQRAIKREG